MPTISQTDFLEKMIELSKQAEGLDAEIAHQEADSLMCNILRQLGYGDGIDIFEAMPKWYA